MSSHASTPAATPTPAAASSTSSPNVKPEPRSPRVKKEVATSPKLKAAPAAKEGKKRSAAAVKREDEDEPDEEESSPSAAAGASSASSSRKRIRRPSGGIAAYFQPEQSDQEMAAAAGGEEESKESPAAAVPQQVNLDRVRWLSPDGQRLPLGKITPWRPPTISPAPAAAAAAASSGSSAGAAAGASSPGGHTVVYWMTREQRVQDNWCLLYAQQIAQEHRAQLRVVFSLVPKYLEATERQYDFMLGGLKEVEEELRQLNIPFEVLLGYAYDTLPEYVQRHRAGAVVTCFGPLRISKEWTKKVVAELEKIGGTPLLLVDGHNIVPVWVASDKQEYAARTIRPKIMSRLPQYLTDFPRVQDQRAWLGDHADIVVKPERIDWKALDASLEIDRRVKAVASWTPGTKAAFDTLHAFIRSRLHQFATKRNDPNADYCSGLSPYLHFGQIAPQRCAWEVQQYRRHPRHASSVASFLEELVVRRELSDNHCFYNERYDEIEGASEWARATLEKHAADRRTHLYTSGEFEFGCTHDPLWNAAQHQMRVEGKMHGFMRMYWCKKILEWTPSPEVALSTALYLNDRYNLDGRDPNGFVGCAWSIMGIHDMGWAERPVFGKIRFMNFDGCKRKFKVADFIERYARFGSVPASVGFQANQKKAKERDDERKKKAGAATVSHGAAAVVAAAPPTSSPAAAAAAAASSSSGSSLAESIVAQAAAGAPGAQAEVGRRKRRATGKADEEEDEARGETTRRVQKKMGIQPGEPKVDARKGRDRAPGSEGEDEEDAE